MAKKTTKAKKVTMAKTKKNSIKKKVSFSPQLPQTIPGRLVMVVAVILFAWLGTKLLSRPFASDPYGVTRASNELAVQLIEAHSHAHALDEPVYYDAPHFMLYGDGLLVCGDHSQNVKKGYELKSAKLTESQIDDLVGKITKLQPNGDEERKHTIQSSYDWPIEAVDQVLVNYNRGGVEIRGNEQDHTARFTAIKALLGATCEKYAKSDYDPEKYVLRTQPATEESVSSLDETDSTISQPNADEPFTQSVISRDEAHAIREINQGNNYSKTHKDGKVFATELVPILPDYNPITPSEPGDKDKVEAASYYPTRWFWFYPSDKSLSSLNTQAATVSSQARAFYKQETGRDNSAASVVIVHGLHSDYWYKNNCPANYGGCSSDKDLNAFRNIRNELQARTDSYKIPADGQFAASYVYLYQGASSRGSNYCYGYANQPASITASRGDIALVFGFGSTSAGCSANATIRYATAAHELGHNLGMGHVCSDTVIYIMCPTIKIATWPSGYNTTSTQQSQLKAYSLFLNHLIYGVVKKNDGTPVSGAKITSCNSLDPDAVTTTTGAYSLRLPTRAGYCLRLTVPSGYKITATSNNPEHASATSYEYNLAGYNCYKQAVSTSCNSSQVTWDMSTDLGKNFVISPL